MRAHLAGVAIVAVIAACSGKRDARFDEPLAYLPRDTQVVMGMDLTQLRRGPLAEALRDQIAAEPSYAAAVRQCKLEPLELLDRAVLGVSKLTGTVEGVIVLQGRNMPALLSCLAGLEDTAKRDGEVVILVDDDDGELALAAANETTIVGRFGFAPTAREVRDVVARTSSIVNVPAFMELYRGLDTRQAFWVAAKGEVLADLDIRPAPRSVGATLRVGDTIQIAVRIRFSSSADAKQALDRYGHSLEPKELGAAKASVRQDGADVTIAIETSAQVARQLIGRIRDEGW
jgi:hypothetical protein